MYQKIIVIGHLGRDPESKTTSTGKTVCTVSLATSRATGQGQKETTWFVLTAFDHSATYLLNYAKRGSKVLVEGRLNPGPDGQPRAWIDKNGLPKSAFEIIANDVKIVEGFKNDDATPEPATKHYPRKTGTDLNREENPDFEY